MQPRAARDERGRFPDIVPTCRVLQGLELKHNFITDNLDELPLQNFPLSYF